MSEHTHRIPNKKRMRHHREIVQTLRTLPYEKGFHFYTAVGNFTGEIATSLEDFEKKIQTVPAASVSFHLRRGDFQKWIEETLEDNELAMRISTIDLALSAEETRRELLAITQTRIAELKRELPHGLRHHHN
jgi:hypothetical protein